MLSNQCHKLWAIVPAAGIGRRMGSQRPKQYLPLLGQPILSHSLARLAELPELQAVVVALNPNDSEWSSIPKPTTLKLLTVDGGMERFQSVYNALLALKEHASDDDWVLVHDAVRPCVRAADINNLLYCIADHPVGGLLALKMTDTVKLADSNNQVVKTVDRNHLWRALTPQIFRYKLLVSVLRSAIETGDLVTDEAQAMESAGHYPLLVEGSADNIKITTAQDIQTAELYLQKAG